MHGTRRFGHRPSTVVDVALEPAGIRRKRVALVIGYSIYQPFRRWQIPKGMFKGAEFNLVEFKHDLGVNEIRRALRDFSNHCAMPR
jgi:hypothetical protein